MSWLSLFLFLLMGGIIFFQSIHGMFSALIMAVICVLSATAALGAHEALAQSLLYDFLGDYAYATAFVGLFALSVIVLRVALDMLIPRSTLLPAWVDKLGAAGLGVITGLVCTGVMGIGIQMLPFGADILGYRRIDEDGKTHSLWLNPEGFTISLCGWLANSTTSEQNWFDDHPDFLTELHWWRSVESTGSRISVPRDSVKSTAEYGFTRALARLKPSDDDRRGRPAAIPELVAGPPPGMAWVVVGVQVGRDAQDSDGKHRASPSQVRLVGDASDGRPAQYGLKAFNAGRGAYILAEDHPRWGRQDGKYELVFEVPAEGFTARFVEYKRAGRAEVKFPPQLSERTPVMPATPPPQPSAAASGSGGRRGGGATAPVVPERPEEKKSHFGDDLPMTLKRYTGDYDSSDDKLVSGHLVIKVDKQEAGEDGGRGREDNLDPEGPHLKTFRVPDGTRLLQLNIEAVHAKTQLAGLLNLTRRVLQQYRVVDRSGKAYLAAGMITEVDLNGERLMEIQYWPEEFLETERSPLRRPRQIEQEELKGDYRYVLLFVVPPAAEITTFDSGSQPVDIADLNLIAPP
jgi:hypothetical protein